MKASKAHRRRRSLRLRLPRLIRRAHQGARRLARRGAGRRCAASSRTPIRTLVEEWKWRGVPVWRA